MRNGSTRMGGRGGMVEGVGRGLKLPGVVVTTVPTCRYLI